ncbi:hypothetical protein ABE073_04485 [Lederbergia citrisecunda]|uniref:hypothetical protein n=1 Tax=Lederbergia citrisecunda TaxID=2833583 RepID=UPI003D27F084
MAKNTGNDHTIELVFKDLYEIHLKDMCQKTFGISKDKLLYNKSKFISDEEINEIIAMLHPHYKEMQMRIYLHKNKFQSILGMLNPFNDSGRRAMLASTIKGVIAGNHRQGEIILFPFNYQFKNVPNEYKLQCYKLLIISNLLHEIRHAYQWTYKKKKYNKLSDSYVPAGREGYHSQWIERDANKFAQRIMNSNKQNISYALGISFDWECIWGAIKVDL